MGFTLRGRVITDPLTALKPGMSAAEFKAALGYSANGFDALRPDLQKAILADPVTYYNGIAGKGAASTVEGYVPFVGQTRYHGVPEPSWGSDVTSAGQGMSGGPDQLQWIPGVGLVRPASANANIKKPDGFWDKIAQTTYDISKVAVPEAVALTKAGTGRNEQEIVNASAAAAPYAALIAAGYGTGLLGGGAAAGDGATGAALGDGATTYAVTAPEVISGGSYGLTEAQLAQYAATGVLPSTASAGNPITNLFSSGTQAPVTDAVATPNPLYNAAAQPNFGSSVVDLGKELLSKGSGGGKMGIISTINDYAPLINAGLSLFSGKQQSNAAKDALSAQNAATQAGRDETARQYDLNRSDLAPYRNVGTAALGTLATEIGTPTTSADVMSDPGYQFGLDQGQQALDRKAAAAGGRVSGASLKAATQYGTDYASNGYNAAYSRRNDRLNRLSALAGIGQTATSNTVANGSNSSNAITNLITNQGNATAANALAQGSIWGNTINSISAGITRPTQPVINYYTGA